MNNQESLRKGKLEKAELILPEMLKESKLGKEFKRRLVIYHWEKIVGRDIAAHARPVKVEFKSLFVKTSHPAWSEQLKYMEHDIKKKINAFAGERVIEKIVFSNLLPAREMDEKELLRQDDEQDLGRELKEIVLPEEEQQQIKAACSVVTDEKLREKLEMLGINVHRMAAYKRKNKWHSCSGSGCNVLCPPEKKYCFSCQRKAAEEKRTRINSFLMDMPWARYSDVIREVSCTEAEYEEQRKILLQNLASKVEYGDLKSLNVKILVMLYKSLPPEQLNENVIKKAMYSLRFDVRYVPGKGKKEKEKEK